MISLLSSVENGEPYHCDIYAYLLPYSRQKKTGLSPSACSGIMDASTEEEALAALELVDLDDLVTLVSKDLELFFDARLGGIFAILERWV